MEDTNTSRGEEFSSSSTLGTTTSIPLKALPPSAAQLKKKVDKERLRIEKGEKIKKYKQQSNEKERLLRENNEREKREAIEKNIRENKNA